MPLPLPLRRMWPIAIFFGVAFLIFAGIAWVQIASMHGHEVKSVFDLAFVLFQWFWVLTWSVGVFIPGALTVLFLIYGESVRLRDGRLIHTPRLGPLRLSTDYNLVSLFISHAVSFFTNYLGRREHLGMNLKKQISEPYKRIIDLAEKL